MLRQYLKLSSTASRPAIQAMSKQVAGQGQSLSTARQIQSVSQQRASRQRMVFKARTFSTKNDDPAETKEAEVAAESVPQAAVEEQIEVTQEPLVEAAAELEAQATETVEEVAQEAKKSDSSQSKKVKDVKPPVSRVSPAVTTALVEDQQQQLENQQYLSKLASSPLSTNLVKMQKELETVLQKEKTAYLKHLDNQEKLIKNEANTRIFAMVDETQAYQQMEREFVASQASTEKKTQEPEEQYNAEMQRKEIYAQYASSKPYHKLESLKKLVLTFSSKGEKAKREIFKSLKMGQYKELARLQLYSMSVDSSKHNNIQQCQERLGQYKKMLKAIIPDKFQEEYNTLQQIKEKRENVDRIFTEAGQAQTEQVNKMIQVQTGLRKHAKALLEANAQIVKNALISKLDGEAAKQQVLKTYDDFVKTQADIKEVQALLNEMPSVSTVGSSNQAGESGLVDALEKRTEAEVSAEQTRNVMLMVSKSRSDLNARLGKEKKQIQEREKALNDLELGQEDVIQVITSKRSNDSNELSKGLINKLNKYNVDPVWLKNQRTQRLTELLNQEYSHVGQRAAEIEDNLFLKEHDNLVTMINNKVGGKELHQYLLARMTTAASFSAGQSKDQALSELVQERLRANYENRDFDQSKFISERVARKEAKSMVKAPSKTVFDAEPYKPRNVADQKEIEAPVTYNKYKFNQLQALEELNRPAERGGDRSAPEKQEDTSLLARMSSSKRHAWLRIYNDFLDSRDTQAVNTQGYAAQIGAMNPTAHDAVVSDQDFFELFRGWKNKELDQSKSDHRYEMGLQVNSPPAIGEVPVGISAMDSLGQPFARDPELRENQQVGQDALEATRHHEALLAARQQAATQLSREDVFIAGEDPQADLREAQRGTILAVEGALTEFFVGSKALAFEAKEAAVAEAEAAGDQEAITAAAALDPEQETYGEADAAALAEVQGQLAQAKAAFQEQFGESPHKERLIVRSPGDRALDPAAVELEAMGYPTSSGHRGGSWAAKRTIARMDDTMVRRIEAHLAGTTLPSLDFGADQEYLDAKHRSENQVFDEAGFEAHRGAAQLAQMSKYGQQQELLYRMKTKEVQETLALQEREQAIAEVLESAREAQDSAADRGRGRDDAANGARLPGELARAARTKHRQLQNQIRTELNRLGRAGPKAASAGTATGEALLAASAEQEQQLVHEMDSLHPQRMNQGGVLSAYINNGSGAPNAAALAEAAEDAVMGELAQEFAPFDFDVIASAAKARAQEHLGSTAAATEAAHAAGTQAAQNASPASSLLIKEQAQSSTQSPLSAKLAALYDDKNPVRQSYLRAKYQMYVNEQIRASFATTILLASQRLQEVQAGRERLHQEAAGIASQYTTDFKTSKAYNFTEPAQKVDQTTVKALEILQRLDEFDPQSQDVQNYNDELRLHVSLLKAQKARGRTVTKAAEQIRYVLDQMESNGVKGDIATHSVLFKKNVLLEGLDEATVNLHRVNQLSSVGRYSEIQGETLQNFFEQSLSRDNFNGLAHLATFTEKFDIDISSWPLSKFRPALDFYLNHTPDLNKILTFTRFYTQFVNGALRNQSLEHADDAQRIEVFQKAFGSQLENLVDMNALFKHLVNAIGSKQFIDPVSKQDPVEQLITFYTQDDVQSICRLSEQGTTHINHSDIVKYIANHFDSNQSFAQLSKAMLKLDFGSHSSQQYTAEAIQALKGYQATHKRLPRSFSEDNVRRLYIQTKELNKPISESTAEYLLFLFKSIGMAPEAIDLCSNYHTMVKGYASQEDAKLSDIRNYYLSDSLLAFPQPGEGKTYHELLQEGVFQDQRHGHAYLTAMTKAYFKDGSVDYALKFFQDGIAAQVQQKEDQDDYLVNLFNSTFGIDDTQSLTGDMDLESFREKYLQLMVVREKLKKETKAVHLLGQILDRCDPQEIDDISSLHVVLREEKQLLNHFAQEVSHSDFQYLYELYEQTSPGQLEEAMASFVSPARQDEVGRSQFKKFLKELQTVKARKELLESKVQYQNRASLASLMESVGDDQVELLGNVTGISEALQVLGLSEQEYQQMRASELEGDHSTNGALYSVLKGTHDGPDAEAARQKEVIRAFHRHYADNLSTAADRREARIHAHDGDGFGPDAPDLFAEFRSIYGYDVQGVYNAATLRPAAVTQADAAKLAQYKAWLYGSPLTGADEPLNLAHQALGDTVAGLEDDLTSTLEARRSLVLPAFLEQFNKVQSKNMSVPESLNLVRNESTFSKQEIKYMETTSSKVKELLSSQEGLRELLKDKGKGEGLANLAKQVLGADPDNQKSEAATSEGASAGSGLLTGARNESTGEAREAPSLPDVRLLDPENIQLLKQAGLERGYDIKDSSLINQTIDRFDMLLNNEHSPVISNFLHLLNYQDGGDMPSYEEYYQNWDQQKSEGAHLEKYLQEAAKMESLTSHVEAMHAGINSMDRELQKKHAVLKDNHENAGEAAQNVENRRQRIESLVEQKVYNLYNMFSRELSTDDSNTLRLDFDNSEAANGQAASQASAGSFYGKTLNRDQKIQLMKQALSLEMGGFRSHSVFDAFYAQDLIFFGMNSDIPEAVRLGEHMLGELGQSLPQDIAKAVKKYRLTNNMKYNQAMQRTGPINTSSVYKTSANSGNYKQGESIINPDDPYWQDYFSRNYRAQDVYKLPSAMAWDHKEHGILGEVIDFKKLEENRKAYEQYI